MARFSTAIKINAPREKVWEVLADLGSISKWNPGVSNSHSTSTETGGEGATRHCDLQNAKGGSIGFLEERAFDWRDGEGFIIDVYEATCRSSETTSGSTWNQMETAQSLR